MHREGSVAAVVFTDGSINIFTDPDWACEDFEKMITRLGLTDWTVKDWEYADIGYTEFWRITTYNCPDSVFTEESMRAIPD